MVLCGAALGVWVVRDLRAEMKHVPHMPAGVPSALNQERPPHIGASYKVENFAYLTAITSKLENKTMQWAPIKYGNTSTVGSSYSYDSNGALRVLKDGTYFLYTQLNLTCVGPCDDGSLTVTFEDDLKNVQLSCTLPLRKAHRSPTAEKCWTVIPRLSGKHRLLARMHTTVSAQRWSLDLNYSGFGMFLVDGS
ncbi:uncharacterized protein LOC113526467 isoform X2 [Pangasianodon hypophthalmus]|nr:uncharacterized protein LOC113526467 isoform X2 [Pangasianodon hypophthalmus]